MALIDAMPQGATPGARTAALAEEVGQARAGFVGGTLGGPLLTLYQKLSAPQCWDASLRCAWAAKGIECAEMNLSDGMFTVVDANNYSRIFGANPLANANRVAGNAAAMRAMPEGCFVGFVHDTTRVLRHCMLHIRNGIGAGNKSDCVLSDAHTIGWEVLDMTHFFGKDAGLSSNYNTTVVFAPVTGQAI